MPDLKQSNSSVQVPHQPITDYYTTEAERTNFVHKIFDSTSVDYDQWYRGQALKRAGLQPGMQVLDVGCGTGLVSIQAIKIIGSSKLLTGLDPSLGMMRASSLFKKTTLIGGIAEQIPFPNDSFDFLSMGYALRHLSNLELVFSEFLRVLKPEGKLCILEITRPETRLASIILKTYMRTVIPLLAKVISTDGQTSKLWKYYWDSIEACVPPQKIIQTLKNVGFSYVNEHRELKIFSEYQATK